MILLQNISKRFAARQILDQISFRFPERGRFSLVGVNGAGKTTLLDIICKLEEADDGEVIIPKSCRLGYLPQDPDPNPLPTILQECLSGHDELFTLQIKLAEVLHEMGENYSDDLYEVYEKTEQAFRDWGGYEFESNAKSILGGLGFTENHLEKDPKTLSGGWRMRLELAKLLIKNPNFLILDEPTNHLDLPSMIWLEAYLTRYQGVLLFVSHDRDLLNRLAQTTLDLRQGRLTAYRGNFDSFLEQYEQKQALSESARKHLEKQAAHVEGFIERFRGKPSKAKQVRSRYTMLARLQNATNQIEVDPAESGIVIDIPLRQASGKKVLSLEKSHIGYSTLLAKNLNLKMDRQQKIAIIGANGIGKSTLLKSLFGLTPFLQGEPVWGHEVSLGYYAQDQLTHLDPTKTVLENVHDSHPDMTESKARRLLGAFLIKRDDVFKSLSVLSGGEKSRVGLACLLAQGSNTLLLDEPTNHLDMTSTAVLAQGLSLFEGTVLFVSHNRGFIDDVATHIFAMTADGRSQLFEGTLEDYELSAEKLGFPNVMKAHAT